MMKRRPTYWRRKMFRRLAERDGLCCANCGTPDKTIWRNQGLCNNGEWVWDWQFRNMMTRVCPTSHLEVDHKIPLRDGGGNDIGNLWLLCTECHKEKTIAEHSARMVLA